MDINNLIKTIKSKYAELGVTSVEFSFYKDICTLYVMRNEGFKPHPDSVYVGVEPEPEKPLPHCFAHCTFQMPLEESKVIESLESWINTGETPKELEGYETFSYREAMKREKTPIWK